MPSALHQRLKNAREVKLVIDGVTFALLPESLTNSLTAETSYATAPNIFRLSGKTWVTQFEGQESHLRDSPRTRYLHTLLKHQGKYLRCGHILGVTRGELSNAFKEEHWKELIENGILTLDSEQRIEVLPTENRRKFLEAVEQIEGEIEALRQNGQAAEALEREEEIANIKAQLQRSQYQGRSVIFANRANRDRNAVGNGIRRAIETLHPLNPLLANHLTNSIRLGYECTYQPEKPISWVL